jgi:hypothetical protein
MGPARTTTFIVSRLRLPGSGEHLHRRSRVSSEVSRPRDGAWAAVNAAQGPNAAIDYRVAEEFATS